MDQKRKQSFLLRLPVSVRDEATRIAQEDGTSLNHFIALAVAEKLSRLDTLRSQCNPPVLAMNLNQRTTQNFRRTA